MRRSSCPCCSNQEVLDTAKEFFKNRGIEMRHCPVCKRPLESFDITRWLKGYFATQTFDVIVDENGNPMVLERTPWSSDKPESKRMSYGIDLDKIDISREMALLEKHHDKENARKADLLVEHLYRYLDPTYGDN